MSSDDRQVIIDFDSSPLVLLLLCVSRKIASSWMWRKRICPPSLQVGTQSLSGVSLNLLKGRNIQVLWNAALHYRGGKKTDICVVLPLNGPELFGNVNYMAQRIAVSHCPYRISVVIIQQFAFLGLAKQFRVKSLTLCSEPHKSHCTWNNVFQNVCSLNCCMFSMLQRIFCWLMTLMTTCRLWGTAK